MSRIKHVSRGWTQDLYSWPLDLGLWKWWERKEILTWESQTSGVPFAPNSPPFILFMPPNNSSQSLVLIIYRISPTCTLINMRRDLKHAYITTCKNSTTTGSKSLSSPLLSLVLLSRFHTSSCPSQNISTDKAHKCARLSYSVWCSEREKPLIPWGATLAVFFLSYQTLAIRPALRTCLVQWIPRPKKSSLSSTVEPPHPNTGPSPTLGCLVSSEATTRANALPGLTPWVKIASWIALISRVELPIPVWFGSWKAGMVR